MAQVSSVFMYVENIEKSIEFYNEIVGAVIVQVYPSEDPASPISLALLRIGSFTLMLHPQSAHAEDFADARVGVGMHLQLKVDDVDAFHQHCLDEGAMLSVSGDPTDQTWGWREFALKDPDGYVWSVYQDNSGGQWS